MCCTYIEILPKSLVSVSSSGCLNQLQRLSQVIYLMSIPNWKIPFFWGKWITLIKVLTYFITYIVTVSRISCTMDEVITTTKSSKNNLKKIPLTVYCNCSCFVKSGKSDDRVFIVFVPPNTCFLQIKNGKIYDS